MRADILPGELTPLGLVIASIGFLLTRFTVALSIRNTPIEFFFAGLLPLVMGLGLAAFGVALAVGSFQTQFVRTVTFWTIIGTGSMGLLVVSTIIGSTEMSPTQIAPGPVFSNFLIGGSVGGSMVGVYAARNRMHRDQLSHHANRLATLNRILRDQVLNAVSIIKGHASILDGTAEDWNASSVRTIAEQSEAIEASIEEIGGLTRTEGDTKDLHPVDLQSAVDSAIEDVRSEFPSVDVETAVPQTLAVHANDRLNHVLYHLLDNAARYTKTEATRIRVTAEAKAHTVLVRVQDNGPGLPERERATLESGSITEFDDPRSGFGLNIVRLLVESYSGVIRTRVDDGTTIEIELARGDQEISSVRTEQGEPGTYGVPSGRLAIAILGGLFAGVVMGLIMHSMVGIIPVIGALYGVQEPVIGWVTHEFHSVVFGMIYATLLTGAPERGQTLLGRLVIAIGFATFLWLFAAGVVMPIWLNLLGLPASLPNLTGAALVGHAAWGLTLASVYHLLRAHQDTIVSGLDFRNGPFF